MEKRADIQSDRDFKRGMNQARARFREDRLASVANTADGFRSWARKTYGPHGVHGKLLAIVKG